MDEQVLKEMESYLVHLKDEVVINRTDLVNRAEKLLVHVREQLPKKDEKKDLPAASPSPAVAQQAKSEGVTQEPSVTNADQAVSDEQALQEQQMAEEMGYAEPIEGETPEQHETRRKAAKKKK